MAVNGLPTVADWRVVLGSHLPHKVLVAMCVAAGLATLVSAYSLRWDKRRRRVLGLFVLRTLGIGTCLLVAVQPSLELGNVTRVPNHVAVLMDESMSMSVRPPDGGQTRSERAAAAIRAAVPVFADWERDDHRVNLFSFAETIAPTSLGNISAEPRGETTRLGEALSELRSRYAGRDLGAVIIVSDGIDTGRIGRGPLDGETRTALAAIGAPVHTVLIGEPSLRDVSVSTVLADDFAFVRTPIKLQARVRASGLSDHTIEVTLTRDGKLVDAKIVGLRGDDTEETVTFDWTPDHPGNFVFEIATPVLAGEALATNNRQVFTMKVIRDRVRVLHVCGRPSWDQRFLRSLLRLDPNVDLVSFFILRNTTDDEAAREDMSLIPFPYKEIFEEQLRSFDLVILHNFNVNFQYYNVEQYLPGLRDYVLGGGALAVIGGDLLASGGYGSSHLREVLPVDLDGIPASGERAMIKDAFKPRLSPEGKSHPVTALHIDPAVNEARWAALPALEGANRVARLRPGAAALLVHPGAKADDQSAAPILAVGDAGKGRALMLLTDTAWHWGFLAAGGGDDARALQRFWENAIRWLVRDPALTLLRIDLARTDPKRGQAVTARVRATHADYTPAADVEVKVAVFPAVGATPDRPQQEVRVTTGKAGESQAEFAALVPGAYKIVASATLDGKPLVEEQTLIVRPVGREFDDVIARTDVMGAIAAASGGEARAGSIGKPSVRPAREIRVGKQRTIDLWSHPALLVLALGLLGTEWALRRRAGHG